MFGCFFVFSVYMPRNEIARSYGSSCFSFKGIFLLFLIVAVPVYISTREKRVSFTQHPLQHLLLIDFLMTILTSVRWHLIVALIHDSLIISNVKHFSMCFLFSIYFNLFIYCILFYFLFIFFVLLFYSFIWTSVMYSLEKCLFRASSYFLIRLLFSVCVFFFWYRDTWTVCIFWRLISFGHFICKYLSCSVDCLLFVYSFLCYPKDFKFN